MGLRSIGKKLKSVAGKVKSAVGSVVGAVSPALSLVPGIGTVAGGLLGAASSKLGIKMPSVKGTIPSISELFPGVFESADEKKEARQPSEVMVGGQAAPAMAKLNIPAGVMSGGKDAVLRWIDQQFSAGQPDEVKRSLKALKAQVLAGTQLKGAPAAPSPAPGGGAAPAAVDTGVVYPLGGAALGFAVAGIPGAAIGLVAGLVAGGGLKK